MKLTLLPYFANIKVVGNLLTQFLTKLTCRFWA